MVINSQLIYALSIGLFVGGIAGYVGSLMLSKKMTLSGGALGHLAMPGISLAYLWNFDVTFGALIFLIIGSFFIWLLQNKTNLSTESVTAVVFSTTLAVSFLLLPKEKAYEALLGDVSQVSLSVALFVAVISVLIFLVLKNLYLKIIISSISDDLLHVQGFSVKKIRLIFLMCIALIIALGVRIIGGLMTAALVAIPACTSSKISKNITMYSLVSLLAGSISCFLGILLSIFSGMPVGPMIILSSACIFVLSVFIKI